MKFKVGDKVRAITNNYGITCKENKWEGIVTDAYSDEFTARTIYGINDVSIGHSYGLLDYRDFELITNNKIVITTDGETVTAKKYEGKEVIKSATAKCHPNDEFDFDTGAKIAFDRLTEQPKEDGKFKVGDKVNVVFNGYLYSTYEKWIDRNAPEYAKYWQFNIHDLVGDEFKIVARAMHRDGYEGMLYLIQNSQKQCYLMGEQGLELAED